MNLLTDSIFRVRMREGPAALSLPRLLAALGRDEVEHYVGLQRHQDDAFHVFLCSLAAAVLARRGDSDPVRTEEYWYSGLIDLAGPVGESAWRLVVEDLSRPAFMQPPLPPGDQKRLNLHASTPDELDLLPTGRNHDLKRSRAARPFIDEWVYALISLQTMSGYYGRGTPGITKMNSGFGNRPIVEVIHDLRLGRRWQDAVQRLLIHRKEVLSLPYGYNPRGIALVWIEPWDGETSLPLDRLDPNFIEICRRVRLRAIDSGLRAEAVASHGVRVGGRELAGAVGDGWLPIDLGPERTGGRRSQTKETTEKALTVSPQGLTADLLRRLIFADRMLLSPLQRPIPERAGTVWFRISVLVRGQGTTEGYHERSVPIPPTHRKRVLGGGSPDGSLASMAKSAVDYAGQMRNNVLKRAIFIYLQGAPARLRLDRDAINLWWQRLSLRFDSHWSDAFFPWLWSLPEHFDSLEAARGWVGRLALFGREVLTEAEASMPVRVGRMYRSKVEAERAFWAFFYHNFAFAKEGENGQSADARP